MDTLRTLDGIRDSLQGPTTPQWGWLVIALASLAIMLLLLQVFVSHTRRRRRLVKAWGEFAARLGAMGLSATESGLLHQFAREESPHDPLAVVERIEVFERAVQRHLNLKLSSRQTRDSLRQAARLVHGVRARLGFQDPPGAMYYSTRELKVGQPLLLRPPDGGQGKVSGVVAERSEDLLWLARLEPAQKPFPGDRVQGVFFVGSRAYCFDSSVAQWDADGGSCQLRHSLDVRMGGAREFHRVEVGKPISFRAEWESADVQRDGTLRNISGGGAAVLSLCYYEEGEKLLVRIEPKRYLPEPDQDESEDLEDRELAGIAVSARRVGDKSCLYHIEFRDLSDQDSRFLFWLVRKLELAGRKVTSPE